MPYEIVLLYGALCNDPLTRDCVYQIGLTDISPKYVFFCFLFFFFFQSDREKMEGLPVAPFMDRDKVTKPTAQIGFIKFVLIPMFEVVAKVSVIR